MHVVEWIAAAKYFLRNCIFHPAFAKRGRQILATSTWHWILGKRRAMQPAGYLIIVATDHTFHNSTSSPEFSEYGRCHVQIPVWWTPRPLHRSLDFKHSAFTVKRYRFALLYMAVPQTLPVIGWAPCPRGSKTSLVVYMSPCGVCSISGIKKGFPVFHVFPTSEWCLVCKNAFSRSAGSSKKKAELQEVKRLCDVMSI